MPPSEAAAGGTAGRLSFPVTRVFPRVSCVWQLRGVRRRPGHRGPAAAQARGVPRGRCPRPHRARQQPPPPCGSGTSVRTHVESAAGFTSDASRSLSLSVGPRPCRPGPQAGDPRGVRSPPRCYQAVPRAGPGRGLGSLRTERGSCLFRRDTAAPWARTCPGPRPRPRAPRTRSRPRKARACLSPAPQEGTPRSLRVRRVRCVRACEACRGV